MKSIPSRQTNPLLRPLKVAAAAREWRYVDGVEMNRLRRALVDAKDRMVETKCTRHPMNRMKLL